MKISYVGNFSQPHCTEVHIANSLESLGHEVIRIQERPRATPGWLSLVPTYTELLLYTRTWGNMVSSDDIKKIEDSHIKTASYHLDLYIGLKRESGLSTDPFWQTQYVFTPDGDPVSQKRFEELGINHYFIPPAVYDKECYIEKTGFERDVTFVGGGDRIGTNKGYGHEEYPYRDELITFLYDSYDNFEKFGAPQKTVRNAELNHIYASTKVTVGDSLILDGHTRYSSDRLWESIGRGAFIIYPFIEGISNVYFEDGKEVVYYKHGNISDLKQKIDYYLVHDDEREKIRLAGHERCKREQTYKDRLKEALEIINE